MSVQFDRETLERLRALPPREAFEAAKDAVYSLGGTGSEDFLDLYEQLIEQGILSREQIEEYDPVVR